MNATKLKRIPARLKQSNIYCPLPKMRSKKQIASKLKRIPRKSNLQLKSVKSKDSVIYVGTIFPYKTLPNAESVIDLTMSDTSLNEKQLLDKLKCNRLNSVETIQPVRNFEAESCGDFGLIQNNVVVSTYYKYIDSCCPVDKVCVHKVNSAESSFQLKRSCPFTSIDECTERPPLNTDNNLLDDLEEQITKEIDNLEMNSDNKRIYQLDVNAMMQLYNVSPDDDFNTH